MYHKPMFGPKVIAEFKSKYSGKLFVKNDWGNKYVTTGYLTQSGGLIGDLWSPPISNLQFSISNCLILGFATGTAAKIVAKKFKGVKVTGVEIDPVMIKIGKKYFDLDKIPNLKILNIDANEYEFNKKFDLTLIDLYLGDKPPEFIYTDKFLKKIKKVSKRAIFNHLFYDSKKKENAEKLIKKLGKYFKNIKLRRVLTNIMIICE